VLQWARANGYDWEELTCYTAAAGGRIAVHIVDAGQRLRLEPGSLPDVGAHGGRNARVHSDTACVMRVVVAMRTARHCIRSRHVRG
jgi:hypothetical protein